MSSLFKWWSRSANDVTSCSSPTVSSVWSSDYVARSTGDVGSKSSPDPTRPRHYRRRKRSSSTSSGGGSCSAAPITDWKTSFENLLGDLNGIDLFTYFLRREYSEENILFWKDCQYYRRTSLMLSPSPHSERNRKRLARAIYDEYVDPLMAPRQVNLDAETVSRIRQRLPDAPTDLFDAAQQHVYLLMKRDSYGRFVSSSLYQQALNEDKSIGYQSQQRLPTHGSGSDPSWSVSDDDEEQRKRRDLSSTSRWRNLHVFPIVSLPWNRKSSSSSSNNRSLSTYEMASSVSFGGSGCTEVKDEGRQRYFAPTNVNSMSFCSATESSLKSSKWPRSRSATKLIGKLISRLSVGRLSQITVDCDTQPTAVDIKCNATTSTLNEDDDPIDAGLHVDETLPTVIDSMRHSRGHRERSLSSQINRQMQVKDIASSSLCQSTPKPTSGTLSRVRIGHVWSKLRRQKRTSCVAGTNCGQNINGVVDRRLSDSSITMATSIHHRRRTGSNKLQKEPKSVLSHDENHTFVCSV